MDAALFFHRFHFAFTISYHYLFPQFTMGMGLLIVILKTMALRTGDPRYDLSARFWGKIFGLAFAMGVVTGIPMEFQFGTNWARFSEATGGVIGQTLAMEGTFAFFLESSFLGLFLFGHKKLSPRMHWFSAFAVFRRLLDLRVLHRRHQRLHAESGGLRGSSQRGVGPDQLLVPDPQSRGSSGSTSTP